ncbi:glycoside hydrolase family protein [Antarcticimicrobium sediminis]|uniref:Lysozyme n=1 Tax=Antarcticimicrobium sediminis TaxID=2546227 RepID=A0A4R5F0L0_9RHOB|nr:peptidoglycan-binding protein [Antarcticimicrobium sediminis]TDE40944.1 lysozyme [Antarcticimicrobium sediminis]
MNTSTKGIAFLERHEGVVLKAYRDPVGIWTIGPGLTAASGVITPKSGMTITLDQSRALTATALSRNYEPAVAKAMPGANQHEMDGGVSFHWNTGAITKASWVARWRDKDWPGMRSKIMLWVKGGGRVLPGLTRRRAEECNLIRYGVYEGDPGLNPARGLAKVVLPVQPREIEEIRAAFSKLGYEPGSDTRGVEKSAVIVFQSDHDLTADGIIGKATLSTLQRRIDASAKTVTAAAVTATATGSAAGVQTDVLGDVISSLPAVEWTSTGVGILGALRLAWLAYSYRDAIAAKIQTRMPGLATFLRSF